MLRRKPTIRGVLVALSLLTTLAMFKIFRETHIKVRGKKNTLAQRINEGTFTRVAIFSVPAKDTPTVTLTSDTSTTLQTPGGYINPYFFNNVINPVGLCNSSHLDYFAYVHSAPKHHRRRQMVRETWASYKVQQKNKMSVMFVMGVVKNAKMMENVFKESSQHGDILMGDFLDAYRNMTYKAMGALKWISENCHHLKYIIKSDDDVVIDIVTVLKYINSKVFQHRERLVICHNGADRGVIRNKRSKWYITKEEYAGNRYPPYCSGSAYIMSRDVPKLLYEVSLRTPFFWVDDVYITGILTNKLGLVLQPLNYTYKIYARTNVVEEHLKNTTKSKLVVFHLSRLQDGYRVWKSFSDRH